MGGLYATQRSTRQSPYKMRLVIDEIRGKSVNDALAYLAFSKKHAAKQIEKVLKERYVKENTILVNLQNQRHFKRGKDGRYSVAA